jgi:hypothetical protein
MSIIPRITPEREREKESKKTKDKAKRRTMAMKRKHQHQHDYHYNQTSHLNTRTQKRHRDNRPQQAQIHASTVQKLFQAQRKNPHAEPLLSQDLQLLQYQSHLQQQQEEQTSSNINSNQYAPMQKSTLHSFWQLPPLRDPRPQQSVLNCGGGGGGRGRGIQQQQQQQQQDALLCDGCDGVLTFYLESIIDTTDTTCKNCGKLVCDICSITVERRLCLQCAMQS